MLAFFDNSRVMTCRGSNPAALFCGDWAGARRGIVKRRPHQPLRVRRNSGLMKPGPIEANDQFRQQQRRH